MPTEGRDQGSIRADADRDDLSRSDIPESDRINTGTLFVLILAVIVVLLVAFG